METERSEISFRYHVGRISVTVVSDGFVTVPLPEDFVLDTPVSAVRDALRAAGLPTETLTTSFAPLVVETSGRLALIDTGLGPDAAAVPGATAGCLTTNLESLGIAAGDIGVVIITHFHPDHVNGLLAGGEPVFRNAEIRVPIVEWEFWYSDTERARATPGRMQSLFTNNRRIFDPLKGRVSVFAWGDEVLPGVFARGAPGHSIGHTCLDIVSRDKRVFVQSDLTNHAALFLPNPGWAASFDQDPGLAVRTRIAAYDRLAAAGTPVQAFHHPFPGLSRIVKQGPGYRLVPLSGP